MTEDQVGALLYELCVDLGFCPLGGATDPLYEAAPLTAEEFARAFFEADGQSFDDYPHAGVKSAVCAVIAKHMQAAFQSS
jgi:hypothetical protein